MDVFKSLNLNKEPFSNSPDPDFFFKSHQHYSCLQKIEISLRLRRGLNVVVGDLGTGKTTLCRQLIRNFADDKDYETHLILDPRFRSPSEFLGAVVEMFEGALPLDVSDEWQAKELIKRYLFRRGVDEKKAVILIIDEGHKLPPFYANFSTMKPMNISCFKSLFLPRRSLKRRSKSMPTLLTA